MTSCNNHEAVVVVHFRGGRRHTLELRHMSSRSSKPQFFPPVFEQAAPCFDALRSVTMPISALRGFTRTRSRLPALEELCLRMCKGMALPDTSCPAQLHSQEPGFPWHLVQWIRDIDVDHVVLDVVEPSADDVQSMMTVLAISARHVNLSLRGLSAGDVTVPEGLKIAFI
ncbi:hypothetical protein AURDEDRAFT_170321 [Auricularia subglabra TFB-10046 SS5]|nr:hypothetical protein AURDEDRAFT_170321 [Auricularia subglabra TFB-10046 SS5]